MNTALKDVETEIPGDEMAEGLSVDDGAGWELVQPKQKKKTASDNQDGRQSKPGQGKTSPRRRQAQTRGQPTALRSAAQPTAARRVEGRKASTEHSKVTPSAPSPPKIGVEQEFPALPTPSAAQHPKQEAKADSLRSPRLESKDKSSTNVASPPKEVIHSEEAVKSPSNEVQETSTLPKEPEAIVEAPELKSPLDTTASSQDKGKSKEVDEVTAAGEPQSSTGQPGATGEQEVTDEGKKASKEQGKPKSKKNQKKKSSRSPTKATEGQGMSGNEPNPYGTFPANPGALPPLLPPSSGFPFAQMEPTAPTFFPQTSGINVYTVPSGPPMTIPAPEGLYLAPATVSSWLGAPMIVDMSQPGPIPSTMTLDGRAISGPILMGISRLGPDAAQRVVDNADRHVGFVPRDPDEPLPSHVPGKPSHFVYRLDSTGWPCAREGCEKRTNDWDGNSTICLRCGPYSPIRYCSDEHMLEDAGTAHHFVCPVAPFQAPAVELPSRLEKLLPSIQSVHAFTFPEHSRQVAFNATNEAGGYALFKDYVNWKGVGRPEPRQFREQGAIYNLWHTVTFEENPADKDRFNRVLHVALFGKLIFSSRLIAYNIQTNILNRSPSQPYYNPLSRPNDPPEPPRAKSLDSRSSESAPLSIHGRVPIHLAQQRLPDLRT
jgi:hypothetical protein